MQVVVGSRNPVKINAVRSAFGRHFDTAELHVLGVSVPSGVGDQPEGDAETRRGALTRAQNARSQHAAADYWVGMEGGIEFIDGALQAFAWMAITDRRGRSGVARSASLPLPPAISTLLKQGLELGEANDRVFATTNSKQEGGAFGLLTDGMYTREGIYSQTLTLALIPLLHPLFADGGTPAS